MAGFACSRRRRPLASRTGSAFGGRGRFTRRRRGSGPPRPRHVIEHDPNIVCASPFDRAARRREAPRRPAAARSGLGASRPARTASTAGPCRLGTGPDRAAHDLGSPAEGRRPRRVPARGDLGVPDASRIAGAPGAAGPGPTAVPRLGGGTVDIPSSSRPRRCRRADSSRASGRKRRVPTFSVHDSDDAGSHIRSGTMAAQTDANPGEVLTSYCADWTGSRSRRRTARCRRERAVVAGRSAAMARRPARTAWRAARRWPARFATGVHSADSPLQAGTIPGAIPPHPGGV